LAVKNQHGRREETRTLEGKRFGGGGGGGGGGCFQKKSEKEDVGSRRHSNGKWQEGGGEKEIGLKFLDGRKGTIIGSFQRGEKKRYSYVPHGKKKRGGHNTTCYAGQEKRKKKKGGEEGVSVAVYGRKKFPKTHSFSTKKKKQTCRFPPACLSR